MAEIPDDGTEQELIRHQGEWSMVSGERDGHPLPAGFVPTGKRVVKGNKVTVMFGDQVYLQATIHLDFVELPMHVDYTITEGPDKGKRQHGIYEMNGDTSKFCFAPPGRPRPTEFMTSSGDACTLSVWRRVTE